MSGKGQRFIDAGYKKPKPLIIVDGIPIIQHVVNLFDTHNDEYIFIINKKHAIETNMKEILSSIVNHYKIIEIEEHKLGPVYAVSLIEDFIDNDKEVIVSYCDYGTKWNYKKFLQDNRNKNVDGSIACYKGFHPHMLGTDNYAFVKEENNYLIEIKEKESFTNNKMNEYASNGTYYFKNGNIVKKYFKESLETNNTKNGEYYVSLVYNLLVGDRLKVNIFEIEKMLQWGTPHDLETYKYWSNYFRNIIKNQDDVCNPKGTTLIFPMAGRGSRFKEEGYKFPKPFIEINGKEMFLQAIDCLPKSDKNLIIYLKEHHNYLPDIDYDYFEIEEVTQGQACTCELVINNKNIDLEKPIMISACDNGIYYNKEKYKELVNDENVDVIVFSFRNNQTSKVNPNTYAWMDVDENDNIKYVSCKKFIYDDPLKTHVINGTMFFRKAKYFMDGLKKNYDDNIRTNNEFYVDEVINQNIKSGLNVKVFEIDYYICWGTPNDLKTYFYWQDFFDKCDWHPYKKENDITYVNKEIK